MTVFVTCLLFLTLGVILGMLVGKREAPTPPSSGTPPPYNGRGASDYGSGAGGVMGGRDAAEQAFLAQRAERQYQARYARPERDEERDPEDVIVLQ